MQTVKVKKPFPIWIVVLLVILVAVLAIVALGATGWFGDFFGSVATGLTNVFVALFTVPYMWASANWINGLTFTIAGILIVGVIFLMIAKRRYLVSEKMIVAGAGVQYQPQSQLSTPKLYSDNPAVVPPITQPPTVAPEEKEKA